MRSTGSAWYMMRDTRRAESGVDITQVSLPASAHSLRRLARQIIRQRTPDSIARSIISGCSPQMSMVSGLVSAGSSKFCGREMYSSPETLLTVQLSSFTREPSSTLSRLKSGTSSTRFCAMVCMS